MSTPEFVDVEIKFIDPVLEERFGPPDYATEGAAAVDLRACYLERPIVLLAGHSIVVSAGFMMHIKSPRIAAICIPRSGLGFKHHIRLTNGTGLIDSDYQGEIRVGLTNNGRSIYEIEPYERVAQMFFVPVYQAIWEQVEEFTENTKRGSGGFGHSGRT